MDIVDKRIELYASEHCQEEPELLKKLSQETHDTLPSSRMLTGRIEGRLLKLLALMIGARRILEIGTFSGYSALSMAEALPENGELITCDVNPVCLAVARKYFSESPHGGKIRVEEGPALDTIARLEGSFDMVFIDADKPNYSNYYEAVLPLVRKGGLIAIDNVLWSGRVLNPDSVFDKAIVALNKKVQSDERVDQVLLTVRDGLYLARKR
jgi:caffeoyl-CoA O-methyltransferase